MKKIYIRKIQIEKSSKLCYYQTKCSLRQKKKIIKDKDGYYITRKETAH